MDVTKFGKGLWGLLIWVNIGTGEDNEPRIFFKKKAVNSFD
jgi:hypothetical protein